MTCPNCNRWIKNENARYCPGCGTKISVKSTHHVDVSPSVPNNGSLSQTSAQSEKTLGHSKKISSLILSAALIAIFFGIGFTFGKEEPNSSAVSSSTFSESDINQSISNDSILSSSDSFENEPSEETDISEIQEESSIVSGVSYSQLEVQPEYSFLEGKEPLYCVTTQQDSLRMRSGPGTEYSILHKAAHNSVVKLVGYSDSLDSDWVVIEYGGSYGWAATAYLTPIN